MFIEKPMLASPADLDKIQFPVVVSPKFDGIRCIKREGRCLSRSLKPIPNLFVRQFVEDLLPDGIDGELMLEDLAAPFKDVSSAIMSRDGEPAFRFAAFDRVCENGPDVPFQDRFHNLLHWVAQFTNDWNRVNPDIECPLMVVNHSTVHSVEEIMAAHREADEMGFEGVMLRDPSGRYKFGRSTTREGLLTKVKTFVDEEATVIGVVELMHNDNEATTDELGRTKRSSAKAGKRPAGVMGTLVCRFDDGAEFEIGTGFTADERAQFWNVRETLTGLTVKVKHQPPPKGRAEGQAPRCPVFLGFRHGDDQ